MGIVQNLIVGLFSTSLFFSGAVAKSTYDFIVVGGGTAGVAIATRLSQNLPHFSILLVEAGPDGRDSPSIYIPGRKGTALGTIYDWNFTTVPQEALNDRILPQNRGHVLGGSSALNLLSYDRGVEADFDAWQQLGNDGWNWTTMHNAMMKAETWQLTNQTGADGIEAEGGVGEDGPIHFLLNRWDPPEQEAFFPTMDNLGISQTYSFLDGDMLGWQRHTSNILGTNYTRSYSPAYLAHAGTNLKVIFNSMVAKVDIHKGCVKGVTLIDGTKIHAKKEVILSAGSIQSPQLLELSGIGSCSVLSAAGVEPKVELPGVGENLQDHVRIVTSYQLKDSYTSPDINRFNSTNAALELERWENNLTGLYDSTSSAYAYLTWNMSLGNDSELIALANQVIDPSNAVDLRKLAKLDDVNRVPQLEILFSDGYLGNKGYPDEDSELYGKTFFAMIASLNHLFSRGSTHINSSDPTAHPLFDPNYLSNEYDLRAVVEGAKYIRKVATTAPLADIWVDEYEPGLNITSDEQWEDFVKANALSIWHPLGTCAMLPRKDNGVVDAQLKVYGVEGLRVADASIMPTLISGHIQTAVYGIAEMAAEMITAEWSW
ncbi:alcohol oxidase [Hortaea werneckii]|uniref:Glucose-methanol-choline oxidoreductase N-terminal domain-containing protein n=2 Tax=Hortaea werneckii TaxID=91943 RepID=A0A3M7IVK9_HORWE|nr:alcohol oxidase [Hortaea werneckii]OTA38751.1 hypothetical protein BTJ68_01242 [Hortaea werneckii EXF-2000]KAI6852273.1 alcohol oxidase [Hortaea werneckii]KAI6944413.1 alcohol oxidase [Hortaea werneckii]KAI6947156.1 alcohol oxidase [Hortaea werneckii]